MYKSNKALEIKTQIVFNLGFTNNTILSCSFLFFFIIDLYFLIPAVIAKIFNPIAELVMRTGTPINESNAEMETQLLIVDIKIRKCSK